MEREIYGRAHLGERYLESGILGGFGIGGNHSQLKRGKEPYSSQEKRGSKSRRWSLGAIRYEAREFSTARHGGVGSYSTVAWKKKRV